jgi:hypothetical protein
MSKSSFHRVSGRTYRRGCIGNQGAKAEYRHIAGSVVERRFFHPKIREVSHDDASSVAGLQQHARIRGGSSAVRGGMAVFMRQLPT